MDLAIQTRALSKTYRGGTLALAGLDLDVRRGTCFGLLGPNGAGKSTLVKILLSIVRPSSGTATLGGQDVARPSARQGVGYLPEGHAFPGYLTGRGVCEYFGRLAGLPRARLRSETEEMLRVVGLADKADIKVSRYSKGMKQRVGLAQAMLGEPWLVFLDEPTDGLDPMGRAEVRDVIRGITKRGATVFLNSHLLSEVEQICDEVAILHRGRVLQQGPVAQVIAAVGGGGAAGGKADLLVRLRAGEPPPDLWTSLAGRGAKREQGGWLELRLPDEEAITPLIDELRAAKVAIYAVEPVKRTLEQTFVQLITGAPQGGAAPNAAGGASGAPQAGASAAPGEAQA